MLRAPYVSSVFFMVLAGAGCTKKGGDPGTGTSTADTANPAASTLDYIRAHGFPALTDLLPGLPPQLAKIPGVTTDADGVPTVPAATSASFSDVNGLLTDATALSAQGFSEARRLEASLLDLAAPVYNVLGQSSLFTLDPGASAPAPSSLALDSSSDMFDQLLSNASFSIDTGGANGLPSKLVIGTDATAQSVRIAGLWPDGSDFTTGFEAIVRIASDTDMEVTLTLAPSTISGLLSDVKANICADDIWKVDVKATATGKTLSILAHECASTRDAVSSLQLAKQADGTWLFGGSFGQTFTGLDPNSLRGWLGQRQGFVMQAAATTDLSKVAAAAAVLGTSAFTSPTQADVDNFGIGQLLSNYFTAKYWTPLNASAANLTPLDSLDNVAYWICDAPVVSSAIESGVTGASDLCQNKAVDSDVILSLLTGVRDPINNSGLAPSDVMTTLDGLIKVLSIRNSIFVASTGDVTFKTAPDADFQKLDDSRKSGLPATVGDTSWQADAQTHLPKVAAGDVPKGAFQAVADSISKYISTECNDLVNDALSKAGKTASGTSSCGS